MLWRVRNSRGTERFCLSEITGQSSGQKTKDKKTTIKHKANGEENERGAERGTTGAAPERSVRPEPGAHERGAQRSTTGVGPEARAGWRTISGADSVRHSRAYFGRSRAA